MSKQEKIKYGQVQASLRKIERSRMAFERQTEEIEAYDR
jgi:hypothetical protein